jgi:hypothetical protein
LAPEVEVKNVENTEADATPVQNGEVSDESAQTETDPTEDKAATAQVPEQEGNNTSAAEQVKPDEAPKPAPQDHGVENGESAKEPGKEVEKPQEKEDAAETDDDPIPRQTIGGYPGDEEDWQVIRGGSPRPLTPAKRSWLGGWFGRG